MFVNRKIEQELNVKEIKPPIVNQQFVLYGFQCDLVDVGYIGYTCLHLHNCVEMHKQQSYAIAKDYKNVHGEMPQDLLKRFELLKKCRNKFDCFVHEVLFKRVLKQYRLHSCEGIFIIFTPLLILRAKNRFKYCNLHYLILFFLDNGVMTTPKRWILSFSSFVFTVLLLLFFVKKVSVKAAYYTYSY